MSQRTELPRHTHKHYRAQVAALRQSGALKRSGSTWPQLTSGNYVRPSIDDTEQRTASGFAPAPVQAGAR